MAFIYKTTNITNGKVYIGKSKFNNPGYLGSGLKIANAIKKHGKDKFIKTVIEECSENEVNLREIYWIQFYNSMDNEVGYNISKGGEGGNHYWSTLSEEGKVEHNKKISDSRRGKPRRPHTDKTKKLQSDKFWEYATNNPDFFRARALSKCKEYVCVNHSTNDVYKTKNLKEFCTNIGLNFDAMKYNARSRKNFYNKMWSCSYENFDNKSNSEIIEILKNEVYKNNSNYREKISVARKNR